MADRVVKVTLTAAVNSYIQDMEKARKQTQKTSETAEDGAEKLRLQHDAMREIGVGVVAFGALAALAVGVAVAKFVEFDQAISNVKAATQESAENMALLREAALDAGAETVFSATEAANAIEELGKAGLTTEQILNGGLNGALSLAAAGQLSVADAAQVAAIAVKQFNLEGSDVPHVADLLAAGAGKAVGDVKDLSDALGQAGLVANGAGQSIEDTTGVLAAFADAGLLGSDAGTSLKSAIIALQAPTDKSRAVMEKYKLSFYDANGQMLSFDKIAGQLETRLGGLDDETRNAALAQIFGNDALRSANVLYTQGEAGIRRYIQQTNDSGYAAKVAADRLDNLAGDVEKLGGAFDTALIRSGSGANDVLRQLTQIATGVVDAVGSLPEPVLNGGLALAGLAAAVALVGGGALIAVPKIAQFKLALSTLNVSGASAARGIGLATGALALAGVAFSLWAAKQAAATAAAAEFKDSLDSSTGAVTSYTRELVAKKLAEAGAFDVAKKAGISQKELTDAVISGGKALDEVKGKINGLNTLGGIFDGTSLSAYNAVQAVGDAGRALDRAEKDFTDQAAAADESAASTETAADSYQEAAANVDELQSNLSSLIDTINEANGVGQDAVSANLSYRDALARVDETIQKAREGQEGYALTLNESEQAGRDNLAMINDLAGSYQDAAKKQFDLDGNTENYIANLNAGRDAVLQRARDLGATDEQIQFLSDHIVAMPSEKEIKIIAETANATTELAQFIADVEKQIIRIGVTTYSKDGPNGQVRISTPGAPGKFANGGRIVGPGGPRADMVPILASNGEFITNAAATQRNIAALRFINNGGVIPGFKSGGVIQYASDRMSWSAPRSTGPVSVNIYPLRDMDDDAIVRKAIAEVERKLR